MKPLSLRERVLEYAGNYQFLAVEHLESFTRAELLKVAELADKNALNWGRQLEAAKADARTSAATFDGITFSIQAWEQAREMLFKLAE